jgi:hypothetical protein
MAAEEMERPDRAWDAPPAGGMGSSWRWANGMGMGLWGFGWGWVGSGAGSRGPRRAPSGPVPAGPQGPATRLKIRPSESSGLPDSGLAERSSSRSGSPSVRVDGPTGPRAG